MNNLFSGIKEMLEFTVLLIELFMFFKPEKSSDLVPINQTQNYYYISTNNKKNGRNKEIIIIILTMIFTYLGYSLLNQHLSFLLIVLVFFLFVKYYILKINYRKQLFLPTLIAILSFATQFQSSASFNYWQENIKINFSEIDGLNKLGTQLNNILPQIKELFSKIFIYADPTSIAIFATFIFVLFSIFQIIYLLFKSKSNIKIEKTNAIVIKTFFIIITVIFMFYDYPQNPIHIIIKTISHFFNN